MVEYYGLTLDVRVSVHPSVSRTSVRISFPNDNLSKHQWIVTKLGLCIDIVEIRCGSDNGRISSNFDEILIKLGTYIYIKEIWFGIANG